ncbi:MAG: lysophospholipid acyltransferase family protein, partial [candidate division Zixibacteria bacterium]
GYPVDGLAMTQHNPMIDKLLNQLRSKSGIEVFPVGASMRPVFKLLRSGRMIALAPDQHATAGDLLLEVFGRVASVHRGPAQLAIRNNVPIIPICLRRVSGGKFVALSSAPIWPEAEAEPEGEIVRITEAYLSVFERWIRNCPEQWLWTHRRWKVRTDDPEKPLSES